jgi:Na+/H+ antiporter NhaD/arsenite permease-like protein
MAFSIRASRPQSDARQVALRPGARVVIALFAATIATTVLVHQFLHLPPVVGMMTGLGALNLYAHVLHRRAVRAERRRRDPAEFPMLAGFVAEREPDDTFDVFGILARVEWDTLMFFYGVILCVGALAAFGYLAALSNGLYGPSAAGPTVANTVVGLLSAIVDNIPIMFAVLSMNPAMSVNQWLLVTLTAGVGGSLLSIGSAAGVALMGQARGSYTFASHLRWTWAVAIGYAAAIGMHLLVNGG